MHQGIPYRRIPADHLGFVFQDFNLLDTFSLEDNIYLPLVLVGTPYAEMQRRLEPIAKQLGITQLLKNSPMRFPADRNSVPPWLVPNHQPASDSGR